MKLKFKKNVYCYCGNCFKIVNLTRFPAWNPITNTFMADAFVCPRCSDENDLIQPTEGLLKIMKIVHEDKKDWKRLGKENKKYWELNGMKENEEPLSVSEYVSKYLKKEQGCKEQRK